MNDWRCDLDQWQPHTTAPKDGTHIIVSQKGSPLGVFHWEDREDFLLTSRSGKPMPPAWVGVYFISELAPMTQGGIPRGERFIGAHGLDEPFQWKPLPATET